MRILHVIGTLDMGGAQAVACGLAEQAQQQGHVCHIVGVRSANAYAQRLATAGVGFETLDFDQPFRLRSLPALAAVRRRLCTLVVRFAPEVIHAHLFGATLLLVGQGRRLGVPVVQTVHGNLPWYRPRSLSARVQRAVSRAFAQRTARYSVAISRCVQADTLQALRLDASRVPVVVNFVDPLPASLAQQRARHAVRQPLRVGVVARLALHQKGLDVALQALAKVPQARLVVLGDGPDREALAQLATQLGVAQRVEWRGMRQDVYAQLREVDLVWVPSRQEGFGLVAAEAAMMGLPVIASRVGGLPEVVRDGETGWLVEPGNATELAQHTKQLLAEPQRYRDMSAAAVDHAEQAFSRSRATSEYVRVYRKAVGIGEAASG